MQGLAPFWNKITRLKDSYVLLIIIALIMGLLIFNFLIKMPDVGVITIDGHIMDEKTKDDIVKMVRYDREDDSIKAVVLEINSPGGEASKIEAIYL
ncbi:MAG: ATP-dependent Clp protease proteolytic subunit [Methanocellales archaeon]|nr:ATP-dependent Clp protease proteolytic subunit [Methanocellales archaeon]